ncbi:uncharacterized protein LOC123316004 [Coccinella septempunctata]|uniref:uncharacterized protein LOC123316004 n=1 Tax=Coccinella septempunctata TaxID=41139 RepID=UPI001D06A548|nr:uncharacterized protein LOC123316004 [Coccinella septempunctata]
MDLKASKPFRKVQYSMEIFGIWSDQRTTKHTVSRLLYIIICVLFNVSCCLGFYYQLETRKITFIFSNMAILLVGGYGSIAILLQNQKSFNNWLRGMFQNEKFLNCHPNETLRNIYRSNLAKIWPETLFRLNKWSIFTAEAMLIGVFFLHTYKKLNVKEECVASKDCSMIYIGYYYSPWNVDEYYWLANLENVAFGGFCCVVVYWRDMYFTCFICYLRCKLKVLSYVVGHLDEFVDNSLNEEEYFHEVSCVIKQCIQEHQSIFR